MKQISIITGTFEEPTLWFEWRGDVHSHVALRDVR